MIELCLLHIKCYCPHQFSQALEDCLILFLIVSITNPAITRIVYISFFLKKCNLNQTYDKFWIWRRFLFLLDLMTFLPQKNYVSNTLSNTILNTYLFINWMLNRSHINFLWPIWISINYNILTNSVFFHAKNSVLIIFLLSQILPKTI
jgi:hypothetical protein